MQHVPALGVESVVLELLVTRDAPHIRGDAVFLFQYFLRVQRFPQNRATSEKLRTQFRFFIFGFFEIDARFIVFATLTELQRDGKIQASVVQKAAKDLGINVEKANPRIS